VLVCAERLDEPVPFLDGFLFQRSSRPAPARTRYTLDGLAATTSWSIIMNVSRR